MSDLESMQGIAPLIKGFIDTSNRAFAHVSDRLTDLEMRHDRPRRPGSEDFQGTSLQREHEDIFMRWVRSPFDHSLSNELGSIRMEVKTTDGASGGYAVPETIFDGVMRRLREKNPFRRICTVTQVGSANFKALVDEGGASGWVGETDARPVTDSPVLHEVAPTFGTVYAYPKATEESLNDMFFDVGAWLRETSAESFARQERGAIISGTGVKKPTGFFNTAPVATPDGNVPARPFGTLEYIPSGVAGGLPNDQTAPTTPGHPFDILMDTVTALYDTYMDPEGLAWVMNRRTLNVVRKWKDATGSNLWHPSLQSGVPSMLLGYPVVTVDDMPDIAADSLPIVFGNWKLGYLLADVHGARITVDDNITTPGHVKFYLRKRLGGKILDDKALKAVKCSVS